MTGQDGVYLSRLLIAHGYRVVGTTEPGASATHRLRPYLAGVEVVEQDLRDQRAFDALLADVAPREIYNLAAFSSVGASWKNAELVGEVNGMAVLRMLESLVRFRESAGWAPRFYQASTSEMFGMADHQPQSENTPHHPRSPYAAAKSFAHHLTVNYRESYGLYACNGILYNHESPLRDGQFVTRKITRAVAEIALGKRDRLSLGNLDVHRDWGAAPDYVRAMWLMLQQDDPVDFIIATGVAHTLHDLLETAFAAAGLADPWSHVEQDPALIRPAEVVELRGDATKAREQLGWTPDIGFTDLVEQMVAVDLLRVRTGVEEDPAYLGAAPTV